MRTSSTHPTVFSCESSHCCVDAWTISLRFSSTLICVNQYMQQQICTEQLSCNNCNVSENFRVICCYEVIWVEV